MNYQSVSDLSQVVRENLDQVPQDVDLIVGIPRSGMLPASLIALNLNLMVCDVAALRSNVELSHGQIRRPRYPDLTFPQDARHILVVDDSIDTGKSIEAVRLSLASLNLRAKLSYCAVYFNPKLVTDVDIRLAALKHPRSFEWNVMHRQELAKCCVDIDGVLCHDPSETENDDGPNYRNFLRNARPLAMPSCKIGHLVTSRLEKYRPETEMWLNQQGISYSKLHMLDLPDAKTRRSLAAHAPFKAEVFSSLPSSNFFIESEPNQAQEIANLSGKHVLCFTTQQIFIPGFSKALLRDRALTTFQSAKNRIKRIYKRLN